MTHDPGNKPTFFSSCVIRVKISADSHDFDDEMISPVTDHINHLFVAHLHHVILVHLRKKSTNKNLHQTMFLKHQDLTLNSNVAVYVVR